MRPEENEAGPGDGGAGSTSEHRAPPLGGAVASAQSPLPASSKPRRARPPQGGDTGPRGAMASRNAGPLRLLLWLLLLRPQLVAVPEDGATPRLPRDPFPPKAATPAPTATAKPPVLPKACGQRKIIGGVPAAERRWPWQVSLQAQGAHVCGGTLISSRTLDYTVKLGDTDLKHEAPTAVVVPVRDIVIHQKFTRIGGLFRDIALVLLSFPVNYSTHIQPVCLPTTSFRLEADTPCWVTGWGKTREDDKPNNQPTHLQEAELNIVEYRNCNKILKKELKMLMNPVRKGGICAYAEGKDSCQGDSGGPLVCEFNNTWVQMGIVSWGIGCARKGIPGVYSDVRFYKDWIVQVVSRSTRWDMAGLLMPHLCLLLHLAWW
ncbi:PREDICTED: serine protease 44-like isoform X2 [Chinchilla lanigera]|uniref:serine protease 44-like isoform X2 n=1 Tax=Chinchilla lanigera TaxID=34839 RepID=UPI0006989C52|nr:PREDICTED: serine protease 44-like isoform X2 [Chinchilla lanigera]